MKFGFLAHPVSTEQHNLVRACALFSGVVADRLDREARSEYVRMPAFSTVRSACGASCEGEVRYLPYTAEGLLGDFRGAVDYVVGLVRSLAMNGAHLAGLGGATSIIGNRGTRVQEQVEIPVTSGNSLTTYAAHELVRSLLARFGERLEDSEIGIIGAPGSICTAMTRLLLDDGCRLLLVSRKGRINPAQFMMELPAGVRDRVSVVDDVDECLARSTFLVTATSTGGVLDETKLRPGSVVVDVALPRDVTPARHARGDILVLDGGLMSATDQVLVDGLPFGLTEQLNGCLAETIVLALEGRAESFSLGRTLEPVRVREIGAIAGRHGFVVAPAATRGRMLTDDRFVRVAEFRGATRGHRDPTVLARRRFAAHVNPPMADLYAAHGVDRVFVSGHGTTLTTEDGTDYLDFVGGYGSLNVGHNHPRTTSALRQFLDSGEPTFVQYTSIPARTSELAERLCAIAPGTLERVFFSNSGAEAVEAALKLVRAATGRTRIVYTSNSYHGKTLGALSVTDRSAHASPFRPLLPDCVMVPFGDEQALRDAIGDAAAFIVEPVQGEGGVIPAPPGYLAAAGKICRDAGAVFVVDEIQTGLGRTGRMFACEWEDVRPDVICLAKSLSGGLVPIGATLATAEVWEAAYGTTSKSVLHTSTFGGGNLASAVALATLDTLHEENLVSHAETLGAELRASLSQACAPFSFVGEVRGIGMMNAIAFAPGFDGAGRALADDLLTRLPGNLRELAETMPDPVLDSFRHAGREMERALGDLLCMRFIAAMGRRHRILTFVTANSNQVMRIQPPLVVTDAEAERFVVAVREVCESMEHLLNR